MYSKNHSNGTPSPRTLTISSFSLAEQIKNSRSEYQIYFMKNLRINQKVKGSTRVILRGALDVATTFGGCSGEHGIMHRSLGQLKQSGRPAHGIILLAKCVDGLGRKNPERLGIALVVILEIERDTTCGVCDNHETGYLRGPTLESLPDLLECSLVKSSDDFLVLTDGRERTHETMIEFEEMALADLPAGEVEAKQVSQLLEFLRVHNGSSPSVCGLGMYC